MLFSRLDGNLKPQKDIEPMNQAFTTFHELMIAIQSASNGALPHSIDHFMEQTLTSKTKEHLLKAVNSGKLSIEKIANAMISAGDEANHGSIEPVEEYLLRVL